jgi:hypothetical protein
MSKYKEFEGIFEEGDMREGLLIYKDGSSYKGMLKNNRGRGKGLYIYASGS